MQNTNTHIDSEIESRFKNDCPDWLKPIIEQEYPISHLHIDFAIPLFKIAIELDGLEWHDRNPPQKTRDNNRDLFLISQGWKIYRFDGPTVHTNFSAIFVILLKECQTRFKNMISQGILFDTTLFLKCIEKEVTSDMVDCVTTATYIRKDYKKDFLAS
jgi:very-short-patch-repair endonuclease